MIFRPRVAPMYVNASAANGTVTAAARNAGSAADGTAVNRSASQGEARYAIAANGSETAAAIQTERRTRPRARRTCPRPARIATRRTFATSIPKRVAAAATNAAWVVSVTTQ